MRLAPRRRTKHAAGLVLATLATTLLAGLLAGTLGAGTAQAAAYRFWGFYQWKDSAWSLASVGPAAATPADGTVDGWRLAVSAEDAPPRVPRAAGDFDALCAGTPAEPGKKRVGVVVDYGLAEEEPSGKEPPEARGACAVVDPKATSAQVLATVAEVRESKSLICGVDAFPPTGCGDPLPKAPNVASPEPAVTLVLPAAATPSPTTSADAEEASATGATDNADSDGSGGFFSWPVAVIVVVLGLVLAGFVLRRRAASQDG